MTYRVLPLGAELIRKQSQLFTLDTPADANVTVEWKLSPAKDSDKAAGTIDKDTGVYTAASRVWVRRSDVVTAWVGGKEVGAATVNVSSNPAWTIVVGLLYVAYAALFFLLLLLVVWPRLHNCALAPSVAPPSATLGPQDRQQFAVVGVDVQKTPIVWAATPGDVGNLSNDGVYQSLSPVKDDMTVLVTATRDKALLGTATIYLRKDATRKLAVAPGSATLRAKESQQFVVARNPSLNGSTGDMAVSWSLAPEVGQIDKDGRYVAPKQVDNPDQLTVTASTGTDSASATVLLTDASGRCVGGGPPLVYLLLFVILMGAIGSFFHAVASFTQFAGSRELVSSWSWWYALRPLLGAAAALIGYFLFGAGMIPSAGAVDTGDLFKVGALAALFGMFAENVSSKLSEVFDSLFRPAEKTKDKLGGGSNNPGPPATPIPTIKDVSLVKDPDGTRWLVVTGDNVPAESTVRINGQNRDTIPGTASSQRKAKLLAADTGSVSVTIVALAPDGRVLKESPAVSFTLTI